MLTWSVVALIKVSIFNISNVTYRFICIRYTSSTVDNLMLYTSLAYFAVLNLRMRVYFAQRNCEFSFWTGGNRILPKN